MTGSVEGAMEEKEAKRRLRTRKRFLSRARDSIKHVRHDAAMRERGYEVCFALDFMLLYTFVHQAPIADFLTGLDGDIGASEEKSYALLQTTLQALFDTTTDATLLLIPPYAI